jgi:hypothetical protein
MITNVKESQQEYNHTLLSKDLVEREKMYHIKNKELSTQVSKVLKQADFVVKEGRELLTKPFKTVNPAAENDAGYHLNLII